MPTTSVVLNHILPLGAVDLGRLVLNVKDPSGDFYEPKSLPRSESKQRLERFSEVLSQVKGSQLHGFLTSALTAAFASKKTSTARIESSTCIKRQLLNSGDYFDQLCRIETARAFLERAIKRNRSVFLVVGIQTLTDATVVQTGGRQHETSVEVQVPVAAVAAAAGIPLPAVGDLVDYGAGRSQINRLDVDGRFYAPGEQVYAVQYRKVEFSFFTRTKVDNAWLEKGNRWKAYVGLRGADADAENDGIEATLSDIQQGQLAGVEGGESECFEVEGEELIYLLE